MTRRLFMVRHGETVGASSIRFYGATDLELDELGRDQVGRLGPLIASERFEAVVHSPLIRARQSAAILLESLQEPPAIVESEPSFRELDFGVFEGMTIDEIENADPAWFEEWQAGRATEFPGGDSIAGFRARVSAAFRDVIARHPDGDLLVVAHKGVLKNGLATLCGYDFAQMRTWDMDLGSLWVIEFAGDWILKRSNVVG
ncbi:MAG: histidine phosphatase family protein [Planctomycetes bacterium]|nr:histidine phosphatase family protein [Planctomycetota bacterium]